ncbi:MAG: hypothetical protein JJU12_04480 [Chlamydiales bacterium]|nr:hypothetical protein [Chlamydiales bacterium]
MLKSHKIPLFFKWVYGVFMAVYIPIFWAGYGPQHFLWLSSTIVLLAFPAALFEWRFLAGMVAIGGLVPESFWTLDFVITTIAHISGGYFAGFTAYMYNPQLSLWLRVLALYHLALPPMLIWMILRLGYDHRTWIVQVVFTWIILLSTWFLTDPSRNINLVFSYEKYLEIGALPFLVMLFAIVAAVGFVTHIFFKALEKRCLK